LFAIECPENLKTYAGNHSWLLIETAAFLRSLFRNACRRGAF
jgi:hypothetical protein